MSQPTPDAPGVTLGYLLAGAGAAALWIGVGIVLIPAMLLMAMLHWLAAGSGEGLARSHHAWLGRHHAFSVLALIGVLIAPLLALPTLLTSARTVLNTLAYAPHPLETLSAAWPQLGVGTLFAAGMVLSLGWIVVTLWISVRLIRRWLRWAERRAA